MAAQIAGVFDEETEKAIKESKVLVVGAGGIGCELLKNLVLTGFHDIEIIDLDTIDVSNLNRQFLFQKKHVGKSKAMVARETALKFNPHATIVAYHDSVISEKYGLNFIKRFTLVLNALDNLSARSHVNRLCLAGAVPLVESGTAGYEGQAELILKGRTKCYDCDPKVRAATYPACTIRNTPTELVHCVVWAKCLFNQLYGEIDSLDDEDVSPDLNDPELAGEGDAAGDLEKLSEPRVSTRAWAEECGYSAEKLFTKLFTVDIRYLLKMTQLWEKRRQPQPLVWGQLPDTEAGCSTTSEAPQQTGLKDQRCWSVAECVDVFTASIDKLKRQLNALKEGDHLVWDKDDQDAMDFVAACANIRAHIFSIGMKSRFDVKSMAGNIIPAIATTNAIVSGLVVLHALNIVCGRPEACASVYLRQRPNHRGQLVMPEKVLNPPNKKCYVCSAKPEVTLCVDINKMSLLELEEVVLKKTLNLAAPDVVDKGSGSILLSSEEGETTANHAKKLVEMGVRDGTILAVDDFLQKYELRIIISQREIPRDGPDFVIVADPSEVKATEDNDEEKMEVNGKEDNREDEDDDDLIMMSDVEEEVALKPAESRKRKSGNIGSPLPKKRSNLEAVECEVIDL